MIKSSFEQRISRVVQEKRRIESWRTLIDTICQVDKITCNNCKQVTHGYYKENSVCCSSCSKRINRHE